MADIPFIDLHPDKIRGSGPETALLACRQFLEQALMRGNRDIRIITGLGIHGDGSPRLRSRVEREVLGGFASCIVSQHYEQGGAVIRLELQPAPIQQGKKYKKRSEKEREHKSFLEREERLMVALERYESAQAYLDDGDLRRCRLKLNQIAKEFFTELGAFEADDDALRQGLRVIKKKIDALA